MSGEEVKAEAKAEVDVKVVPSLDERVGCLVEKVEALKAGVDALVKADIGAEFSKEDRAVVISAFKAVHSELGKAFGILAEKDISYKATFDSKRGLLVVRLFKLV